MIQTLTLGESLTGVFLPEKQPEQQPKATLGSRTGPEVGQSLRAQSRSFQPRSAARGAPGALGEAEPHPTTAANGVAFFQARGAQDGVEGLQMAGVNSSA